MKAIKGENGVTAGQRGVVNKRKGKRGKGGGGGNDSPRNNPPLQRPSTIHPRNRARKGVNQIEQRIAHLEDSVVSERRRGKLRGPRHVDKQVVGGVEDHRAVGKPRRVLLLYHRASVLQRRESVCGASKTLRSACECVRASTRIQNDKPARKATNSASRGV